VETRDFSTEFSIKATRSSGKGGQNVNKVSTKIELSFNLPASKLLSDAEKVLLFDKWKNRLSQEGDIRIVCQEDRSQLKNKEFAIKKFYALLKKSLQKPVKRIAVKPSKAQVRERLEEKKHQAKKKELRKGNRGLE
jgi:ribosome-associated protein